MTLWITTIKSLFGELSETMVVATNAYLLPQYPYWTSISEAVEILQKWLGPEHARNLKEEGPLAAGSSTHPVAGQIVNPRTQDYVYQLQLYLEAMKSGLRHSRRQRGLPVSPEPDPPLRIPKYGCCGG